MNIIIVYFILDLVYKALAINISSEIDFHNLHVKLGDSYATKSMFEALQQVSRAIKRTNHRWRVEDIWSDPHQLLQFFKRPPSFESEMISRSGDIFDVTINLISHKLHDQHHRSKRRVNETDLLSEKVIKKLMEFSGCKINLKEKQCSQKCLVKKYRTITGECNNFEHPYWGATNLPLTRWRPSQYENNFNSPRGWNQNRLYNSFPLPLVRKVSNDIMSTMNNDVTDDPDYSHLLVVWGQYVDHDMDFTPQSLSTSSFQGLTDCRTTCENKFPCFPMMVPDDDPRITTRRCIPFFRSAAVCGTGHTSSLVGSVKAREQINSINAFVDGSALYGNTESQARELRDLKSDSGLMKSNKRFNDGGREYLPFNPVNPCVQDRFDVSGETIPCFKAGDGRASEHQTLAIIHTLWLREHNRIARRLRQLNSHWSSETVYQEARKIIGAYHQVVNWNEYLPKILGPEGLRQMGQYRGYDAHTDPSISNVFATAAFRFGHVTIHPEFRRLDANFEDHPDFPTILLHEAFFASWRIIREGGADPIIRGLIGRAAKLTRSDQLMHEELREKLFALQNKVALDLASLNLQRGRDHALPGYNEWRVECNMTSAENFSMLAGEISDSRVRDKLEELYGHPDNVDVWLGGLAEDLLPGSRTGPLFTCLIARQFKQLRDGDRFFYRNPGQFSTSQLANLERMTFARIICENSGVDRVQPDVFQRATFPQDFQSCSDIPQLDLELWRENPEVAGCGIPPSVENGAWKKCDNMVSYFCHDGFTLNGADEITCQNGRFTPPPPICSDINECEDQSNGGCSDICRNFPGSFECACADGQVLDSDQKTCTKAAEAEAPQILESFSDSSV